MTEQAVFFVPVIKLLKTNLFFTIIVIISNILQNAMHANMNSLSLILQHFKGGSET